MHKDIIACPNPSRLQPFQTVADYAAMDIGLWNAGDIELLEVEQIEVQFALRRQFRQDFGYVVASAEVMTVLAELLQNSGPVLDAGCGSGYLTRELNRLGVTTFAVDYRDFRVERPVGIGYPIKTVYQLDALGDAPSLITSRFGAVLMTWPPYGDSFALNVAMAMLPGQWLVYEGEIVGGCTANTEFFEFMNDSALWQPMPDASSRLNAVHVTLATLHDHWTVWKRIS